MKGLKQGRRIVSLVRGLTVMALLAGAVMIAMFGWTLAQVRSERSLATEQQDKLRQHSDALRQLAIAAKEETNFDETDQALGEAVSLPRLVQLVHNLMQSQPDTMMMSRLHSLDQQMAHLIDFNTRGKAWQEHYRALSEDISHDLTMGKVRTLIAKLHEGVEEYQGRLRLNAAIKYRQQRNAVGEEARHEAQIAIEESRRQGDDFGDFNTDLAELSRLAELLNVEQHFDRLADLKDNRIGPVIESLRHSLSALGVRGQADLRPENVRDLQLALCGATSASDDSQHGSVASRGGLFGLRYDYLESHRQLDNLKHERDELFQAIEAADAGFTQVAQVREATLTKQVEENLAASWRRSLIFGGCWAGGFLWLAFVISRGVGGQVRELETRTSELTREIAERERVEQDLRRLRNHQEMIFNAIGEGIHWLDRNGNITFENPAAARLLRWEPQELIGKPAHETLFPRKADGTHYPKFESAIDQSLQTGETQRVTDEIFWRKDGTSFPVEYTTAPVRDNNGEIMGTVIVFTDITERKTAEAHLEETNQQLRNMSRQAGMAEVATGVLHNVGNVLNSVNVSSSLINETLKKSRLSSLTKVVGVLQENEPHLAEFMANDSRGKLMPGFLSKLAAHLSNEQETVLTELKHLQQNVEHIKKIVATQQSFASSAGCIERIDFRELVEAALRMNKGLLDKYDVAVIRNFNEIPVVLADKHKVLQIFVNLISNAAQAMRDRPIRTMTIAIEPAAGETVHITVRDTGCGIMPENMTRIFAHGFTTKRDGHGFGLHSSALAAKEMKGSLTLHSDGVDKGAVFTLELPAATLQAVAA